jgi:hypothetical protein
MCTPLHCTALHCTALHCTALHCTALTFRKRTIISTAPGSTWPLVVCAVNCRLSEKKKKEQIKIEEKGKKMDAGFSTVALLIL